MTASKQNQQNKDGGSGTRLVINWPASGVVVTHIKGDKYDVLVQLSQSQRFPPQEIGGKVFANDKQIGGLVWIKEPQDHLFEGVSLDKTKPLVLEVRRAGANAGEVGEKLPEINLKKVPSKSSISTSTAAAQNSNTSFERFEVSVGRFTPGRQNPVTLTTRNDQGQLVRSEVRITLGQQAMINGTEPHNGLTYYSCETGDGQNGTSLGEVVLMIQLLDADARIEFHNPDSGIRQQKTLLKEF